MMDRLPSRQTLAGMSPARAATAAEPETITRLAQFAWLIDNVGDDRSPGRLRVFWNWAEEMAYFQSEANRTGKAVKYFQRGKILRTLNPKKAEDDCTFIEGGPFANQPPAFVKATREDEASIKAAAS